MERSLLILRHFLHLAIELRCGSLIDTACLSETKLAHSLQHTKHTHGIHIGRKLRRVEAHLHMALRCKVIDLIRTHLADNAENTHRVTKVGIMQMEIGLSFKMSNTLTEVNRRASYGAMHLITFFQ